MTKAFAVLELSNALVNLRDAVLTNARRNNQPKRLFVAIHQFEFTCFPVRVRCLERLRSSLVETAAASLL